MSYLQELARENLQTVQEILPEQIKTAAKNNQHHHIMAARLGLNDFSFAKVAEYLGGRIAARHLKWRPVKDGFQAFRNLRG